jgi:hypothetical protein
VLQFIVALDGKSRQKVSNFSSVYVALAGCVVLE